MLPAVITPPHIYDDREPGMMTTTGVQGVGKTFQNMWIIARYIRDKIATKVKGRKCLIFDTNGEYVKEEFVKNGIKDLDVKLISLKDVYAWCRSDVIECRRIDAKHLTIGQKKQVLEFLMLVFKNGMLVLEDINNYVLKIYQMEEVIGRLISLRHAGCDILISYQTLRAVEPRIWGNSRWVRMHFQADDVNDIKDKVTNPELFKIAQIMVDYRYYNGDERFFVYITNFGRKLEGNFKKNEFMEACKKYLNMNKSKVNQYMEINECDRAKAITGLCNVYYKMYYDNKDKEDFKQVA